MGICQFGLLFMALIVSLSQLKNMTNIIFSDAYKSSFFLNFNYIMLLE